MMGDDLSTPRGIRIRNYNPDMFGNFAETFARFLGTGRYLGIQTVVVVAWILFNSFLWYRFFTGTPPDKYPFILLNLFFSTQASYAAPLILLAQNRQTDRDRIQAERDREMNARSVASMDFLAREIAAIRIALETRADREDIEAMLERLTSREEAYAEPAEQIDRLSIPGTSDEMDRHIQED
jgi:uncharacterized membrane protein